MCDRLHWLQRYQKLKEHHRKCEERFDMESTYQREHERTLQLLQANINCSAGEHHKETTSSSNEPSTTPSVRGTQSSVVYHLPSSVPFLSEDESQLSSHSGSDEEYHPPAAASSSSSSSESELLTDESAKPEKPQCASSSRVTEILTAKSKKDTEQSEAKNKKAKRHSHQLGKTLKEKTCQGATKRSEITIKTSNKKGGAGAWDKAHYCVYCKKPNLKITSHLQRKHGDEKDVARAYSFPPSSKERKTLLEALRNKGDWHYNLAVFEEGSGEIVTWRQPTKKVDVKNYLPCQHCYAMFVRTELWRHEKTCREQRGERAKGKRTRVQKSSSQLIPVIESSEGVKMIIHSMQQDHVNWHIRSDEMICTYGDALFAKKFQHKYIAQKLRELGRFVLAAKQIDKSVKSLRHICDPAQFQLAIKAARAVSNYNSSSSEYGKPSTAVKIGCSLKGATEAWIGRCLITCDSLNEKKAKKFKELLESSWSNYVSANAHSTIEQRKWGKEDSIPLTEDVVTLQNYLKNVEDEAMAELKVRVTTTSYKELSESLLAQIIVFNKECEGEASRLTLDTYQRMDTGPLNKDIYETLSPVEQQLSHRLTRLVTRGKRGRKVPILLLERTKASLDFLIEKRRQAGVVDENPYVFARPGTTTSIRGCDCLRKFAEESKAKHPELLRSTKLRKHVATLCQLLDLDNQELEQVARFMGHDIRVHCDYYRQTDKTFQVAKIGKLLFAMEHGAQSLKGKSLKTLDSVIRGRRPAASTSSSLRVDHSDGQQEPHDEEEQMSSVQIPKTITTSGPEEDHDYDADGEGPESPAAILSPRYERCEDEDGRDEEVTCEPVRRTSDEQQEGITNRHEDDEDKQEPHSTSAVTQAEDDDEDIGEEQLSMDTKRALKRPKKTAVKRKQDNDNCDEDGHRTTSSPVKSQKKTASQRQCNDDNSEMQDNKPAKRPWTVSEKTAVKRQLGKFIALRKVPAKHDCMMCIGKESGPGSVNMEGCEIFDLQ